MQVECIRDFGGAVVGDVREVPDGSSVDPVHWRPVTAPPPPAGDALAHLEALRAKATELAATTATPVKEGMLWHRHPG